jgi:hypothetical protein
MGNRLYDGIVRVSGVLYRGIVVVSGIFFIISAPVFAQEASQTVEIPDNELEDFVSALKDVEEIQETSQQTYTEMIEEEGMTEQRFGEIHNANQNPDSTGEIEISDQENESYQVLLGQLIEMQQEAQQEMQAAVTDNGLEVPRFNEILVAVQQDPGLQERVQELLE